MSINFSQISRLNIPNAGDIVKIKIDNHEVWPTTKFNYVSFGDSIAAGHTINEDWESDYGWDSQFGKPGMNSTVLVPGCYTELIGRDLSATYGADYVSVMSYAQSGDQVRHLMTKLDDARVRRTLAKANLVTLCIGANDVLTPAMLYLGDYINGDISGMLSAIQTNLDRLNNDNDPNSYRALLNKLYSINPNARYVFTTIYNPYKYLYLEKSTAANNYKDGFLGPLMWSIPDFLGDTIANTIRAAFLKAPAVENLFDKINQMPLWAEGFVTSLNNVLKAKVAAFGKTNFVVADSKTAFETIPDRIVNYPKHYNDLISVEFTKGFTIDDADWGKFWADTD